MAQGFQIGTAATATGLSVDAIRFYQKSGLVNPVGRSSGGYRLFTDADIAALEFVAQAQGLRFSLAEIKELLSLKGEKAPRGCMEVRNLIDRKLANVREKIAALQQLEIELAQGLQACDRALKARRSSEGCPVIDQIARARRKRNQ